MFHGAAGIRAAPVAAAGALATCLLAELGTLALQGHAEQVLESELQAEESLVQMAGMSLFGNWQPTSDPGSFRVGDMP